jgi:hypothetical protein
MLGLQSALGARKEPETPIVIILVVQPRLEVRGAHGQFCCHDGVSANPVMVIVISPLPYPHRHCRAGIRVTMRSLLRTALPPRYRWTAPLPPHCWEGGLTRGAIALVDVVPPRWHRRQPHDADCGIPPSPLAQTSSRGHSHHNAVLVARHTATTLPLDRAIAAASPGERTYPYSAIALVNVAAAQEEAGR